MTNIEVISDRVRATLQAMLAEDIGSGDVTTALFNAERVVSATFRARSAGVTCGFPFVCELFTLHDTNVQSSMLLDEGTRFEGGSELIRVTGRASSILQVERTALNLYSRLCGIAARTRIFVEASCGKAQILDTRKTTPLLRVLEKYAVRIGGGHNHRMGLYDMVLAKDNHLTLLGSGGDDFNALVLKARERYGNSMTIEIEVDSIDQFVELLPANPDIVLLDNFRIPEMITACALRDKHESLCGKRVLLEASGGVTEATVGEIAKTGVDRISAGSLTYNPVIVDIGLDFDL